MSANPADWTDDDDRIGVPRGGVLAPPAPPPVHAPPPEPVELRPGETELGRPVQAPVDLAPLTDDDRRTLRETEQARAARELAEAEELLATDPAVLKWAGMFAHPLAAAFLVGAVGVLGLFVSSQVVSVLNGLAAQPEYVRYAGYAGLGLLTLAVLYSMLRLGILYLKLQRNRQIRLAGLQELQTRTRLRWLAAAKTAEAKARLEDYLRTFPIETPADERTLGKAGLTPAAIQDLRAVRAELLDPARFAGSAQWFDRFRGGFQGKLDAAADARVKYWANRAMLVTALAPNGLIDGLATSYFGFAMLADQCRVYNLRAGRAGTTVLLARVFFNAYLAGQMNDWEKLAEDQYDTVFNEAAVMVGAGVGGNVASKVFGKVGAKATTGYLNRVLLIRLGRYSARLLRPVGD